jgi:hypothetical protein
MRVLLSLSLALAAVCADDGEIDCPRMKTKALRKFLAARGLKCEGCAEKADYVSMCEEHKDTPELAAEEPAADWGAAGNGDAASKDPADIDDLLKSMKGMPGMEGIKMFGADDLKNMNFEQMGQQFGGRGQKSRKTREQYKEELKTFYETYGMTDKVDGIDAALDKWKGREQKMFDILYKKYDEQIRVHWDKKDSNNENDPGNGEEADGSKEEL